MGIVWGPLATSESGVYLSPASCTVDARSLVEHVIMTVHVSDPYMGPQNWFPEGSPLHTPKYCNPPYGDPTGMGSPNIDPHVIVSQNKGTPRPQNIIILNIGTPKFWKLPMYEQTCHGQHGLKP